VPAATDVNAGLEKILPFPAAFDIAYTGRYLNHMQIGGQDFGFNLNTIDLGMAFRPDLQDQSIAVNPIPGAGPIAAQNPNQLRGYRGYGSIAWREYTGWRKF